MLEMVPLGLEHGDLNPIDRERLLTVLKQHIIDEAIERHFCHRTIPAALFTLHHDLLGLPKGQPFIKLGMRVRLTHQDKVETMVESQGTKRLFAVEIIAQQGYVMRDEGCRMVRDPPFASGLLTVLFCMTV